jgi:hypothetical protein
MAQKKTSISTPRTVFMHLLVTIMLYVGVVSFITILFQYINVLFPDKLTFYRRGIYDAIRTASSALIVVFPVYMLVSFFQQKEFVKNPQSREVGIRKWLVYLTLFIAAITIIIDLIQLVNSFYGGELTIQFALKTLSVLAVAIAVFSYYFWDLRRKRAASPLLRPIAIVSTLIVLITMISGFFIVGSPAYQRKVRFDDERITNLQEIQSQIVNYYSQKQALPESLNELKDTITGFVPPVDPETGSAYKYTKNSPLKFTLCAEFHTKTADTDAGVERYRALPTEYGFAKGSQNWAHKEGQNCFERTIDPDFYPKKQLP